MSQEAISTDNKIILSHREDDELVEPCELANALGHKTQTLAKWRCTGAVEFPYTKVGKKVLYHLGGVRDVLRNNLRT